MVSLGAGLLGGAASGAATGGLASGITSGLADGSINGLTGMGNTLQGVHRLKGLMGDGGGSITPGMIPQSGQPQYGNNNGDALSSYVMQLLNTGRK